MAFNVRLRLVRVPKSVQLVGLSAAGTAISGVSALAVAKWLGATDRGIVATAQALSALVVMGASLGLLQGARVLLSRAADRIQLSAFLQATRLMLVLILLISAVIAVGLLPALIGSWHLGLIGSFLLLSVGSARASLLRESLHGVGWHRAALAAEVTGAAFSMGLLTITWIAGRLNVVGVLAILAGGVLVNYGIQATVTALAVKRAGGRNRLSMTARWSLLRMMVTFSWPGLVSAAGLLMANRVDRILLAAIHGPTQLGVYATASTISDVAWTLPVAISPMIVRAVASTHDPRLHVIWWRRVLAASLALSAVAFILGFWLLERFLGDDFHGSSGILAILLISSPLMASQQVDLAVCNGFGDVKSSARASVWGLAIGTAAYLVLIPPFGIVGCAWGNVATFAGMAAVARVAVRRHVRSAAATNHGGST